MTANQLRGAIIFPMPGRLETTSLTGLRILIASLVLLASVTAAEAHDPGEDEDAELCIANGGPFGVPGLQDPPAMIGQWLELPDWGYKGAHASLLHTGKIMRHTHQTGALPGLGGTTLWHPSTPSVLEDLPGNDFPHPDSTVMGNPPDPGDMFCAGHTPLTDGRILTVGGGGGKAVDADRRVYIFHGDTDSGGNAMFPWIRIADMSLARAKTKMPNAAKISARLDTLWASASFSFTSPPWSVKTTCAVACGRP